VKNKSSAAASKCYGKEYTKSDEQRRSRFDLATGFGPVDTIPAAEGVFHPMRIKLRGGTINQVGHPPFRGRAVFKVTLLAGRVNS
jgi:hypothetical protein